MVVMAATAIRDETRPKVLADAATPPYLHAGRMSEDIEVRRATRPRHSGPNGTCATTSVCHDPVQAKGGDPWR